MSSAPVNAPPIAPKQNINVLPKKNAITVVQTAILLFFANRIKFGVAVPPEIKEPITYPIPVNTLIFPADCANTATRPPPSVVAVTIE